MLPKLYFVCAGLGGVRRGFETYIHQLATELQAVHAFDITTMGAYKNPEAGYKHITLPAIKRDNRFLSTITKNLHRQFHAELQTLFPALAIYLLLHPPKCIYIGEYKLYCYLFKFRKLLGLKWSLCLYTGGQAIPGLFNPSKDWVHHVTDAYWLESLGAGIPEERQFLIPHFVKIAPWQPKAQAATKWFSTSKKVVLSVGSIDESVKKMRTLVKALAQKKDLYFPVLVGSPTVETRLIEEFLAQHFGNDFFITELSAAELPSMYAKAHVLVSCSLKESFGLVMLEAMMQNCPVVCVNWPGAAFVFQHQAQYITHLSEANILQAVNRALQLDPGQQREYVIERFSWNTLANQYINMFRILANS